jgi:hypothetical protein
MQQRVEGLEALRTRASAATTEFYAMIGKIPPAQPVRYQVVTKGPKAYHIIERASGKTCGFRFSWKEAVNFAQQLEARADGVKVTLAGVRQ